MKFELPEILIVKFDIADIITVSGNEPTTGENELPGDSNLGWD